MFYDAMRRQLMNDRRPEKGAPTEPTEPKDTASSSDTVDETAATAPEAPVVGKDSPLQPLTRSDVVIHSKSGDVPERELRERIEEALQTIYDPEIPVDIFQLGLIYSIEIAENATVSVEMTLTSPACPVAGTLPPEVEEKVADVNGVDSCTVDLVWEPSWHPGMMTESARLELGFF